MFLNKFIFLDLRFRQMECDVLFTWNSRRVWILVDILHVLHQIFSADANLLTQRTTARVRTPDQGRVLLRERQQQKKKKKRN